MKNITGSVDEAVYRRRRLQNALLERLDVESLWLVAGEREDRDSLQRRR
jgi:hypothetical protein